MSYYHSPRLNESLSSQTSFFGIRLWIVVVAFILLFALLLLIVIFTTIIYFCRHKKPKSFKSHFLLSNPISCSNNFRDSFSASSLDKRLLSQGIVEIEMNMAKLDNHSKDLGGSDNNSADLKSVARRSPLVFDIWKGNRFAYKDIEVVTNGFSDENLIGNGDRGVVYHGILLNATRVAVKTLLSKSCQDEKFVAEMEVIGHVRHKNLVKLLGYCMEGGHRILVNEYVDNGNLHHWLHGRKDQVSHLTWSIRMNIIQAVAKGLAYLHEDIEPRIVHQNIKSTNILLDRQWNPKISDFGIVKLCSPEGDQTATRLMGTSGYLSKEYASNGVLNERTDVYSFGILIMEIISGRTPVDHNQPHVYLVDWLKSMIASHQIMYIADPKLPELPSSKDLKRVLLLALRCVDPDIKRRPTMGDVIYMLEPQDLLLNEANRIRKSSVSQRSCSQECQIIAKSRQDDFSKRERESSRNVYQKIIPK